MLKVLQYSWVFTALISFGIAIFNLVQTKIFSQAVFIPFILAIISVLLVFAMKGQEKSKQNNTNKKSAETQK